ncbi:MAG: ribosome maturation factor RimP [Pseudomonadota bacterium]
MFSEGTFVSLVAITQQERNLLDLIAPEADRLGYEIVRVRIGGGKRPTLQLMIDRAGGALANVEDCATLSRALSPVLDVSDPLPDAYVLEVSTPGIDRPLTRPGDFARWTGHLAKVELARPLDGRRRFQGVITGEDDTDGATIELEDETALTARLDEMSKATLVLTDALIDAARALGGLPPQPGDEAFDDFEVDDEAAADGALTDDDDDTTTEAT